jgi:tetrahydromethanopterin S-methyltransferase subunit G
MRLTLSKICWGVVGTLFLMTPLFASTSKEEVKTDNTPTYNWAYAEEASGLLRQIRSLSVQLAEDSDFLELNSRWNQLDWRSHAWRLDQIGDRVNAMGENLQRLQEIQSMIAPWQQKALERVMPNAVALASHTEEAIAHLNDHQGNLWVLPYTDHVSAMSDHAEDIKKTVNAFLDYAKTSDRLKGLERQLEFTGA